MRLRALLLGALVVVLRTASVARADDFRDVARAHYARGVQLAGESGYAEALQEFNQAYIVSPEFAVLYNIGECHIALGHTVEAIEALSRYLRDGGERVPAPRRQLVRQQLEMLEARRAADPGPRASAAPTPEPTGSAALAAREMARAQVARGDDLAARNQYAAALRAYSDAYATHADFSTLYSIGHCHVALGHPVEAIDAFKQYLLDGGDRVPAGRGDLLGAQIAMLESRLAELTVVVVGPDARVSIDGRDLGRTPLPRALRMGAGKYRISVTEKCLEVKPAK